MNSANYITRQSRNVAFRSANERPFAERRRQSREPTALLARNGFPAGAHGREMHFKMLERESFFLIITIRPFGTGSN